MHTDNCSSTRIFDNAAGAQAVMEFEAEEALASYTRNRDNGCWIPDPNVRGVWGFESPAGRVLVVAYIDDRDFEVSEALDAILYDN